MKQVGRLACLTVAILIFLQAHSTVSQLGIPNLTGLLANLGSGGSGSGVTGTSAIGGLLSGGVGGGGLVSGLLTILKLLRELLGNLDAPIIVYISPCPSWFNTTIGQIDGVQKIYLPGVLPGVSCIVFRVSPECDLAGTFETAGYSILSIGGGSAEAGGTTNRWMVAIELSGLLGNGVSLTNILGSGGGSGLTSNGILQTQIPHLFQLPELLTALSKGNLPPFINTDPKS